MCDEIEHPRRISGNEKLEELNEMMDRTRRSNIRDPAQNRIGVVEKGAFRVIGSQRRRPALAAVECTRGEVELVGDIIQKFREHGRAGFFFLGGKASRDILQIMLKAAASGVNCPSRELLCASCNIAI